MTEKNIQDKKLIEEYLSDYRKSQLAINTEWKQTTLFLERAINLLEKINNV